MIRGMHALIYTSDADGLRAFLRDKLGFPNVDVGDGWLIFDMPEADLGVHPQEPTEAVFHELSFYCDDIHATIGELKAKGVEFLRDVEDHGWGYTTVFAAPGGVKLMLYQPKYQKR